MATHIREPRAPGRRGHRSARGQGLVEFAIAFPVLTVLVFGGIDFARGILVHNALTNSAREGARYGIAHPQKITSTDAADPNNVVAHVLQEIKNATASVTASNVKVWYVKADGTKIDAVSARSTYTANTAAYPYLEVDVSFSYQPVTPVVGNIVGSSLNLQASTTMAIE